MYSLPFLHTEKERLEFFKTLSDNGWFVEETKQLDYGKVYTLEKGESDTLLSCRFVLYSKKDGNCSKIVIEKGGAEFYEELLEIEKKLPHTIMKSQKNDSFVHCPVLEIPTFDGERIGSDECGKGDFFGPLVVSAVCLSKSDETLLKELNISDSKAHTDSVNLKLKEEITAILPDTKYSIKVLNNPEYNKEYAKFKNINLVLASLHASAIEEVMGKNPSCTKIIVDQFSYPELMERSLRSSLNEKITLFQTPKAERDLAVATASILARATFLECMSAISERLGMKILPGCSASVKEQARRIFEEKGDDVLKMIAKTHFSCYPNSIIKK